MTYRPRIFIRDYGTPTVRKLLHKENFELVGYTVAMMRDLFLRIENDDAGEPALLFSGDEQSGADILLLSGENGYLVRASNSNIRAFCPEIAIKVRSLILLSGDAQGENDGIELSGDAQSGDDLLALTFV